MCCPRPPNGNQGNPIRGTSLMARLVSRNQNFRRSPMDSRMTLDCSISPLRPLKCTTSVRPSPTCSCPASRHLSHDIGSDLRGTSQYSLPSACKTPQRACSELFVTPIRCECSWTNANHGPTSCVSCSALRLAARGKLGYRHTPKPLDVKPPSTPKNYVNHKVGIVFHQFHCPN